MIQVKILGMNCPFCAYGEEQKLKKLDGVDELEVNLEAGVATLTMKEGTDVSNEQLQKTVDDADFESAATLDAFLRWDSFLDGPERTRTTVVTGGRGQWSRPDSNR